MAKFITQSDIVDRNIIDLDYVPKVPPTPPVTPPSEPPAVWEDPPPPPPVTDQQPCNPRPPADCPPCGDGDPPDGRPNGDGDPEPPPPMPRCPPGYKMVPLPKGRLSDLSADEQRNVARGYSPQGSSYIDPCGPLNPRSSWPPFPHWATGDEIWNPNTQKWGDVGCVTVVGDGEPQEGVDYICIVDDCPQSDPDIPPVPEGDTGCCKATAEALKKLADILENITKKTNDKLCDRLDELDECTDKLIEKIKDKILPPAKTCEQCCQRIKLGLATETECKTTFANCLCSNCDTICNSNDPATEGRCCNTCGQKNCICQDGECLPAEEPPEDAEFFAYCNYDTGEQYVGDKDHPPPAGNYTKIGGYKNTADAYKALKDCRKSPDDRPPNKPPRDTTVFSPSSNQFCKIEGYANEGAIRSLFGSVSTDQFTAGMTNVGLKLAESIANTIGDIPVLGPIAAGIMGPITSQYAQVTLLAEPVSKMLGCKSDAFTDLAKAYCILASSGSRMGLDVNRLAPQYEYAMLASCRNHQFTKDEAVQAYLSNEIDGNQLNAFMAISGICPDIVNPMVNMQRAKLSPTQLIMARRRNIIDKNGYDVGMRQLGYINQQYADISYDLSEQVPGLPDIIRFMVRDVDDESVVNEFKLDDLFATKYGRQLKEWAEIQGIPEDVARYAWRAHWEIPSPTALFEFWRRLRKDPKFGGEDTLRDDIKKALVQQDILPRWHDHYLAISTLPLTRTDVRRAYDIGSLDRDAVVNAYQQAGYDDDNAEILTKFTEKLKVESSVNARPISLWRKFAINGGEAKQQMIDRGFSADQAKQSMEWAEIGFLSSPPVQQFISGNLDQHSLRQRLQNWGISSGGANAIIDLAATKVSHHVAIDLYAAGKMNYADAKSKLLDYGMDADKAEAVMQREKAKIDKQKYQRCARGLRRRFLTGELTDAETVQTLQSAGITDERAKELLGMYQCEKSSVGRAVPANHLCEWLERGVLSPNEFITRLERIGYITADAEQMMYDCLAKISVRREEQARKRLQEQEQAAAKARRLAEQLASSIARQQAALERGRKTAESNRNRRYKQQLSIASKIAKKCDCEIEEVSDFVKAELSRLQSQFALTLDDSLIVGIKAADAWSGGELSSFRELTDEFAEIQLAPASAASSTPDGRS